MKKTVWSAKRFMKMQLRKMEKGGHFNLSANPTVGHPRIIPHDTNSGHNLSLPSWPRTSKYRQVVREKQLELLLPS